METSLLECVAPAIHNLNHKDNAGILQSLYTINLPISRHIISLSHTDATVFNDEAIPAICVPIDANEIDASKLKHMIKLVIRDNINKTRKHEIFNFRNTMLIYENKDKLTVEVAEYPSSDRQILANMGISIALCHIFSRENIFLIHSASIVRNGRGYIFPGHSGAGKTTISTLSHRNNLVLCDELSAVMEDSDKRYSVLAGPEWSDFTFTPKFYLDSVWKKNPDFVFPLNAIIFPTQENLREETWLERIKPIDATFKLIVLFADTPYIKSLPPETFKLAFHFFSNLTRQIPCFKIHANIETDIWQVIDETIEAL